MIIFGRVLPAWRDRKSVVLGKSVDHCVTGVQTCALPIYNNVPSYIDFCKKRVPGLTENTIMDDNFWQSPSGVAFLKAQAWHEAGKQYPAMEADWIEAQ